jgi:hypothetical protein
MQNYFLKTNVKSEKEIHTDFLQTQYGEQPGKMSVA